METSDGLGYCRGVVPRLLAAWGVLGFCVVVHAVGVTLAIQWLARLASLPIRFWAEIRMLVLLAAWIIVLHLLEISAWALFYEWRGAMPGLQSAIYFSAVTYTTTGYGDLVLPEAWRLVGAIEALTGILMCGWSTGFFFAVVSRRFTADTRSAA
jgi:voltage-gated potassium channel Kch